MENITLRIQGSSLDADFTSHSSVVETRMDAFEAMDGPRLTAFESVALKAEELYHTGEHLSIFVATWLSS